jgi:HlyD family secretion protein
MMMTDILDTQSLINTQVRRCLLVSLVFGGGALAWSAFAPLEGAIAAGGMLVVESNVKKVQHLTGGIVGRIAVREGQRVTEGELLLRLDDTQTRASLAVIMNDLMAGLARRERLLAERDDLPKLDMPAELTQRLATDPTLADVITSERKVFETRTQSRAGQKAQLAERIGQSQKEIEGLEQQRRAMDIQLRVARKEFDDLKGLEVRGLLPRTRITALDREIARSEGSLGDTVARIAQSRGRISETEIQMKQIEWDKMTEVSRDLRETETRVTELREKRTTAEDQLRRIDIRAPISGIVQQLATNTVGGVVSPTDQLMIIVSDADQLVVEARVMPQDRDQLGLNQATRVRFTSFNQRTTPEVNAQVFRISGDVIRDQQTGQMFYSVGVRVPEAEVTKLNGARLVAGMPAEAYFKTDGRTLMSYLLKPLVDHWQKTFSGR